MDIWKEWREEDWADGAMDGLTDGCISENMDEKCSPWMDLLEQNMYDRAYIMGGKTKSSCGQRDGWGNGLSKTLDSKL